MLDFIWSIESWSWFLNLTGKYSWVSELDENTQYIGILGIGSSVLIAITSVLMNFISEKLVWMIIICASIVSSY